MEPAKQYVWLPVPESLSDKSKAQSGENGISSYFKIYSGRNEKEMAIPFTDLFSRRFESNWLELAGLLAHLTFYGLPETINRNSGKWYKKFYKGLQLRVQLRFFTGFPIIPCWQKPAPEPFQVVKVGFIFGCCDF